MNIYGLWGLRELKLAEILKIFIHFLNELDLNLENFHCGLYLLVKKFLVVGFSDVLILIPLKCSQVNKRLRNGDCKILAGILYFQAKENITYSFIELENMPDLK